MLVGWLNILPPGVRWDIMGYESDPPTSYTKLRNCSHSIMLNYTYHTCDTQVNLPRPGPTILSSGSYLDSCNNQHTKNPTTFLKGG